MSDIDLTEAFGAATDAYWPTVGVPISNRERIEAIVSAAAPLIAAQVRAQIAADIEAEAARIDAECITHQDVNTVRGLQIHRGGVVRAAQIARGGA